MFTASAMLRVNCACITSCTNEILLRPVLQFTDLCYFQGPKSSFITPEKKAKLKCNPVKVRFAEEVEVNGQSQGNSLLFLPNVLKVYLENGQTKAFKFEPSTTVKDIVMTLKEKLSLSRIEHFSLMLEQQPGVTKLLLLHDEERIQQVVQKKEAHDYRCLFRVCFIPKTPQTLLADDPTAFEYLYLQVDGCYSVYVSSVWSLSVCLLKKMKTWGIENFVSSTLLRNMREKDLRKAVGYHMKKCQSQYDPKQKGLTIDQARINYLEELSDLKSFGGKSFSATMMLQDRESTVTLLVGARYGVSQVVNRKLSILSTLTEFTSITRIELLPESDRVSLVKIYLQDIKPITLLLESVAAKDMSCLIAGYCRVFVDPNLNIFPWVDDSKKHRISAEEGTKNIYYDLISCSSSSTHPITSLHTHAHIHPPLQLHQYSQRPTHPHLLAPPPIHSHPVLIHPSTHIRGEGEEGGCRRSIDRADTQFLAPISGILCSDDSSLCFAELSRLVDFLPSPPEASEDDEDEDEELRRRREKVLREMDESMRRAGEGEGGSLSGEGTSKEHPLSVSPPTSSSHIDFVFNFDQSDARCYYNICSNITPDSARSLPHLPHHNERGGGEEKEEEAEGDEDTAEGLEHIPLLQPPPGFGDSSSDEEFFDARDRFTSPEDPTSGILPRDISTEIKLDFLSIRSLSDIRVSAADAEKGIKEEDRKAGNEKVGSRETLFQLRKRSRKRRSFMETEYTSRVSYPEQDAQSKQEIVSNNSDPEPSEQTRNPSPTVSSLTHSEGEPAQLESKPILSKPCSDPQTPSRTRKQEMEMEPDAMESKSVTDLVKAPSPTITVVRCRLDPDGKESANSRGDGKEEIDEGKARGEEEDTTCVSENGPFTSHMFLQRISEKDGKEKDAGEEQREGTKAYSSSSNRPLTSAKRQSEDTSATCLMDVNTKSGNGLLGTCLIALEQNSFVEEYMLEGLRDDPKPLSFSPPPPPPSSPLPPLPVNCISQSDCLEKEGGSKNPGTSIKVFLSTSEELQHSPEIQKRKGNHTDNAHLATTATVTEDELMGVVSSTMTASDEVTDSTSSDNVFDDDEASNSLNSSSSDKRYDWVIAGKNSVSANSEAEGKSNFQLSIKSCMSTNTEAHTRIRSVSPDYTRTINSIAAKLGAATSVPSSTFNSSAKLKSGDMFENINKAKSNSTPPGVAGMESLAISSLAKANMSTVHDVSKDPSSPTHFFFQTCSPSIMGRLSASTLRGKIQKLPLYLSRSQETINQAGVSTTPQSPVEDNSRETTEITISVTDINNVTQTINLDVGTTTESVDSDDSDTTVTGSEVDGEFFMETIPSKNSVFEEKGVTEPRQASFEISPSPVQTEPKHENQLFYTELDNSTPGPIRQPPATIVSSLQHNTSGLHMDTPGPIKNAPESKILFTELGEDVPGKITNLSLSIPPSIVVTTQNLNGPGLSFHSKTQKARQTSSDRPLIGLCRPSEQKLESANTFSSGCRVFTICKDLSQTKTPVEVGRPCLKSEVSCSSVLASGCESVVEGMQIPLDACGCPSVYTNCINEGDSFDEELTVYEFSCRTQSSGVPQMSGAGLPLMTTPPVHSFLSTSSTHSPSFSRSVLSSSSASELSPLLSPLSEASDSFLSQMHKETVNRLGQQRYPAPPAGFQVLRVDVDQLLSILESSSTDRSVASHRGRHPRETCPSHFTENKRVLQIEARRLMSGCQKVVGIGQSPEEMLHSLADSFRTLVELAGICLWFSGCDRCDRRNAEAVAGLADVARSFRDFCLAAERANSKRSCEDLSTKLLAKQCTALTASVFCLTQLFRTLTAL
uniref:FERM domain-containing protein n=1 Tax=Sphaeramia orbicularis TaxID=375764 RepID=A0A672YCN2_9TELE